MKDKPDLHKVTTKGQITLPKKLREKMNIKPGDYISIFQVGEVIVLTKKAPSKSPLFREKPAFCKSFLDKSSRGEQPSDDNLMSLKGLGKGLWGRKEDIEKHIEEERASWEK